MTLNVFTWLASNIGSVIIVVILFGILALIVAKLISDKKKGKHVCGGCSDKCSGACGACGSCCSCGSGQTDLSGGSDRAQ